MKRLESSVKAPDRQAQFEELYAQYADDVLRMAYFYLADKQKAEDVCQDVFVKLYTRGEAIAPGCEKAWLLRVTVNCCRDLWRSAWLKLRVTPKEKEAITAKATMQGQTVTDFLRQRALDYRLRQTPLEKERIRQLARIGANLNQLARWANTWKSRAEAVEILTALASLERALLAKDTPPPPPGEPSCI